MKIIFILLLAKVILMVGLMIYPPMTSGECGIICNNIMMFPIIGVIVLIGCVITSLQKIIKERKTSFIKEQPAHLSLKGLTMAKFITKKNILVITAGILLAILMSFNQLKKEANLASEIKSDFKQTFLKNNEYVLVKTKTKSEEVGLFSLRKEGRRSTPKVYVKLLEKGNQLFAKKGAIVLIGRKWLFVKEKNSFSAYEML